jgi:hypothetical protein
MIDLIDKSLQDYKDKYLLLREVKLAKINHKKEKVKRKL